MDLDLINESMKLHEEGILHASRKMTRMCVVYLCDTRFACLVFSFSLFRLRLSSSLARAWLSPFLGLHCSDVAASSLLASSRFTMH